MLQIDWACKLAPKIKVYNGRGKLFAPFESTILIQNEDWLPCFGNVTLTGNLFMPLSLILSDLSKGLTSMVAQSKLFMSTIAAMFK